MANPPTDYYVDPSLGIDTGDGLTPSTPWGRASGSVIQYALNTGITSRNTTDGDRINVKAGATADNLAGTSLDITGVYGSPIYQAPLIIQGYTSAQGDGGQGKIDCGAVTLLAQTTFTGFAIYDMEIFNGPATGAIIPSLSDWLEVGRCYIHDCPDDGINIGRNSCAVGNRVEDCGGYGIRAFLSGYVAFNYVKQGATYTMTAGIIARGNSNHIINNIVSVDSTSDGILGGNYPNMCIGNTVFSAGGSGHGIDFGSEFTMVNTIVNNYVEGFSAPSGRGIRSSASGRMGGIYGKNAVFNCNADGLNYDWTNEHILDLGDNEVLTVSGIAKAGNDTWANRFEYFAPVDEGNMQTGGYPQA